MENTQSSSNGMTRHMRMLAIVLVPVVALILGAAAPALWADGDGDELEFEEAWFNIEFNSTDEDLGVRGFVDGDPWKEVEIKDPNGRTIANIWAKKSLADQGFAELFFESGEPTLEDVPIATFLGRFPEGTYEFEGETTNGEEIEGEAEFTHAIPCPPVTELNRRVIRWDDSEQIVDTDNTPNADDEVVCIDPPERYEYEIDGYEVIVEGIDSGGEDTELSVKLPADADRLRVPRQVGTITKYEVLRIEASGNQTITEVELEE